jgi:hypothetical protein
VASTPWSETVSTATQTFDRYLYRAGHVERFHVAVDLADDDDARSRNRLSVVPIEDCDVWTWWPIDHLADLRMPSQAQGCAVGVL